MKCVRRMKENTKKTIGILELNTLLVTILDKLSPNILKFLTQGLVLLRLHKQKKSYVIRKKSPSIAIQRQKFDNY